MLPELQQHFLDALFREQEQEAILALIDESSGRSAAEQLAIYRASVFGGLSKALAQIYPVCHKLVGQDFFDAMSEHYVRQHASCSPDLNDYGEAMPEFIASFAPAASLPYLSDVARLEWAWHQAFNAETAPTLDIAALQRIDESEREHIVFQLPPGATLLQSDYPIHRIWHSNQNDYQGDDAIDLDEGGIRLLVWRRDLEMHIDPLEEAEWEFLQCVAQGLPLGRACLQVLQHQPAQDMAALLIATLQHGCLILASKS